MRSLLIHNTVPSRVGENKQFPGRAVLFQVSGGAVAVLCLPVGLSVFCFFSEPVLTVFLLEVKNELKSNHSFWIFYFYYFLLLYFLHRTRSVVKAKTMDGQDVARRPLVPIPYKLIGKVMVGWLL